MGFDTIEINLVQSIYSLKVSSHLGLLKIHQNSRSFQFFAKIGETLICYLKQWGFNLWQTGKIKSWQIEHFALR